MTKKPGVGGRGRGGLLKGVRNLLDMIERFCILIVVVISGVYTTVKTHRIVLFKWMQFIACKLFLTTLDTEKVSKVFTEVSWSDYLP